MKEKTRIALIALLMLGIVGAIFAVADPLQPTGVLVNQSGRMNYTVGVGMSVGAQAGNVTQLDISQNRSTNHWQGYYGNVYGNIMLNDGKNSTLYSWSDANPTGEIFASNTSRVSWGNITCVNLSGNITDTPSRSKINNSIIENFFNIPLTDKDGVNETFAYKYSDTFTVGGTTIDSSYSCPMAYMFINNVSQTSKFKEVLLTDNVSTIWTALLEQDQVGFDGSPMDFQLIVPEDSAEGVTNYYFFVELS